MIQAKGSAMNLDNVRDLKSSLLAGIAQSLEIPSTISTLGLRARASTPRVDALRTIALGIARRGKQHRLAVRLQRRALIDHPYVEGIRKQAKGEVDVRYVGRISKLETPSALQRPRRPLVI